MFFYILLFYFQFSPAWAFETDQLTCRSSHIRDAKYPLNSRINTALDKAILMTNRKIKPSWPIERIKKLLAEQIQKTIPTHAGLAGAVLKLESWMDTELHERGYSLKPKYKNHDFHIFDQVWNMRNTSIAASWYSTIHSAIKTVSGKFVAQTFRFGNLYAGSDKIGHFFSDGFQFWENSDFGKNFKRGLEKSTRSEIGRFGGTTTGVISFGDLHANLMGYLFYEHMLGQDKLAIFDLRANTIIKVRQFDIMEYITPDWDELANPSIYARPIARAVKAHLAKYRCMICSNYKNWRDELLVKRKGLTILSEYVDLKLIKNLLDDYWHDPFELDQLCRKTDACNLKSNQEYICSPA